METMIKNFCKKYRLPESGLSTLLSHMTEVRFGKGEFIVKEGERNSNFYLVRNGIWRAYSLLDDGTENSLWFAFPGDAAFSSWGYIAGEASLIHIESVNESTAYCISKTELENLFSRSIEMANFGRHIFERELLSVDIFSITFGTPSAKERYLTLIKEYPELLQDVPLKHLASYLYITPQSLSRIRAGLRKKALNRRRP